MKNLLTVILFSLCILIPMKGEATHHYLWSNTDYAFWLDDQSIHNTDNKTWASFDIIFEDMRSKEQLRYPDPTIIYRQNKEWYVSLMHSKPSKIDKFDDWWQPWALKWLLDNGYLTEEEDDK